MHVHGLPSGCDLESWTQVTFLKALVCHNYRLYFATLHVPWLVLPHTCNDIRCLRYHEIRSPQQADSIRFHMGHGIPEFLAHIQNVG
jgi:hypothetical protein